MDQDTKLDPKELNSLFHQIRNSLTVIQGNADLIKMRADAGSDELLYKITSEIKHLSEILDEYEG